MRRFATHLMMTFALAMLLPGLVHGQRYAENGSAIRGSAGASLTPSTINASSSVVLMTFSDRPTFDITFPIQNSENFSSSGAPAVPYQECGGSLTFGVAGDPCYNAFDLPNGIIWTNSDAPAEGMALITNPDPSLGPNNFGSEMQVGIGIPAAAVGFDIWAEQGNTQDVHVVTTFSDLSTHIEDLTLPASNTGFFFGIANPPLTIQQIEVHNGTSGGGVTPPDSAGEIMDNFVWIDPNVLPVELTAFDAVVNGTSATLTWATASEENNSGFEIQQRRSNEEDADWTEVDFVPGHGTTSDEQRYEFRITDLGPGAHQFRLKQIDFDGAFEYSAIVEALVELPGAYALEPAFPNPFNPTTNVRFMVAKDQQVRVALFNSAGQEMLELYTGTATANESQLIRVDATGLPSGTYFVQLQGEGFMASEVVTLLK